VRHREAVPGPSSDVFSLGGIRHVILSGTPPDHRPGEHTLAELIKAIADGHFDPRQPGRLRPRIEPQGRREVGDLEPICLKALDGDPTRRPPQAEALMRDLDAWLEG
jgi:hypothetical protein